MAVSTTNAYSGPYTANGSTTSFPFTFSALSSDDVAVLLRAADGTDTVADTDDYTVTFSGSVPSAGSVVFDTAPASGVQVLPYLDVPFTQQTAFADGSAWKAAAVNNTNDRAALRDQVLKRDVDRSLAVPLGEAGFAIPSTDARAEKALFFDADGNPDPISIDDFSAPALAAATSAELFALAIQLLGAGIIFDTDTDGVAVDTGVASGEYFVTWEDARVRLYLNNAGSAVEKAEFATVASLPQASFSQTTSYGEGTVGQHLKAFIVASDAPWNVRGDDSTDNDIAAIVTYAASLGGGDIILPSGVVRFGTLIDVTTSNVRLIGQGCDTSHGAGTNFTQKTVLKWTGSVGGTMIKFRTPYGGTTQRRIGMGLIGVELNGDSKAAIGLELDSIALSEFRNIHIRHCTTAQYNLKCGVTGTDGPAGEALDIQLCNFSRCTFDTRNTGFTATAAKGWVIDGSTNANVSGNVFELLNGIYSSGTAYDLIRADNNVFTRCSAFRSGGAGTVYTWTLTGSNSATGTGSYGNTFVQIGWDATYGFSMGASVGADSINARVNTILGYDEANGGGAPVVGANSRVIYLSSKGKWEGVSRVGLSQLAANPDNGISIEESGNRHDLWVSGDTLNYAGNGIAGTFKAGGNIDVISAVGAYKVDGQRVVQTRKTGWATATGTATRTTFDTSTVTLPQLAERVKAMIDDLHATAGHGLIGS